MGFALERATSITFALGTTTVILKKFSSFFWSKNKYKAAFTDCWRWISKNSRSWRGIDVMRLLYKVACRLISSSNIFRFRFSRAMLACTLSAIDSNWAVKSSIAWLSAEAVRRKRLRCNNRVLYSPIKLFKLLLCKPVPAGNNWSRPPGALK